MSAFLRWATDDTYAASAEAWAGQSNKVVPPEEEIEQGHTPGVKVPAEYENYIKHYILSELENAYKRSAKGWSQAPTGHIGGSGSLPNVQGAAWCKTRNMWVMFYNINATNNGSFFAVKRDFTVVSSAGYDALISTITNGAYSVVSNPMPICDLNGFIIGITSQAWSYYDPATSTGGTSSLTSGLQADAIYYEPGDRVIQASVIVSTGDLRFRYQERNPVGSVTTAQNFTGSPVYSSGSDGDQIKLASNQINQIIGWQHNYSRRSVFSSADGGTTWTENSAALPVVGSTYAHGFGTWDPVHGRYVMPVFDPTNFVTHIWTSEDGISWTDTYTIADKALVDVKAFKRHLVAAGNQKLLGYQTNSSSVQYTTSAFVSFDGGGTWIETGTMSGDTDSSRARVVVGEDQCVIVRRESATKSRFLPSATWE